MSATIAGALLAAVQPTTPPDHYVEAIAEEPPLFNPILAPYTLAGQDLLPLIFSGLVRAEPSGSLAPDLAERWDVSADGRSYTFRLRDGLTWHDGAPLNAHDVTFTIHLIQSANHQGSQELAELWRGVEVEVVDERNVRFSLPEPLASFPDHLTLGLLPRHLLEGSDASALLSHPFNRDPIGSGPYRVATLDPARVVLERHTGYHGAPPRLSTVELRYFADRGTAVQALIEGQVDGMGHLRAEEIQRLADASWLTVYSLPERSKAATLALNVQTPLFRERAVRLALAQAIDRDALIRAALDGQAEPAFGPIPIQSWAYDRPPGAGSHDPSAAAALLEAAGWATGPSGTREREGRPLQFTILAADTAERSGVAQELARQLAPLGFDVTPRVLPADELTEDYLEPRRFEAAIVGQWTIGNDPDVFPQWHSSQAAEQGGNYAGFSDPDSDRWLEVARQQLDADDRRNSYVHFQTRWAEEQPSVVLYHPIYSFAVSKDLHGVAADPLPDSSWRLRDAVNWHRQARPTTVQRARAWLAQYRSAP